MHLLIKKTDNLTYYQMGQYIDEHISLPQRDDTKIYEYLFHMIYMLARTNRLFRNRNDYEEYSLWLATNVYSRLTSQKHIRKNNQIGIVGAYIKQVVPLRKNDFLRQSRDIKQMSERRCFLSQVDATYQKEYLQSPFDYDNLLLKSLIDSIPIIIQQEVRGYFFRDDREWENVVISVSITLTDWVQNKKFSGGCYKTPRLYNLDTSFKDIVIVFSNKVMSRLIREIKDILNIKQSALTDDWEYKWEDQDGEH